MSKSSPAIPHLPNEIWSRIASFVPQMPGQPSWQAWTEYRTLNKTFKDAIETYYVKHYLHKTTIHVDCGSFYPNDCPELDCKLMLNGRFTFDGFYENQNRMVIFREKEVHAQFARIFTVSSVPIASLCKMPITGQ